MTVQILASEGAGTGAGTAAGTAAGTLGRAGFPGRTGTAPRAGGSRHRGHVGGGCARRARASRSGRATAGIDLFARRMPALPQGTAKLALTAAMFAAGVVVCAATGTSVVAAAQGFGYSTLALIIAMEIFTGLVASTGVMEWLAVRLAAASKGSQGALLAGLCAMMFVVSSFLNNITAVLVILPCIFVLLRTIAPDRRYLATFFCALLAVSNLGGAASAVGDLPAILIMQTGIVTFGEYTLTAFPFFAACAALLVAFWSVALRARGFEPDREASELAVDILGVQYRHVRVDARPLAPLLVVLACMLVAWMALPPGVMGPELVAVLGCVFACAAFGLVGGRVKQVVDFSSVLTVSSFLFLAACIDATGVLTHAATELQASFDDPKAYLTVVLVLASALSGMLGAGPAAAICLPVVTQLAGGVFAASHALVMVAYGAAICAGSSMFLFSATAGFILAGKVDTAGIADSRGRGFTWGIGTYLPYGIVNYAIQMGLALAFVALAL